MGQSLSNDKLFLKTSKIIDECVRNNIPAVYIKFGNRERKIMDTNGVRIYYSKRSVDGDRVAEFLSIYTNDQVHLQFFRECNTLVATLAAVTAVPEQAVPEPESARTRRRHAEWESALSDGGMVPPIPHKTLPKY